MQPIICAYTDSDIEGYYLFIAEKNKMISSLKIGQSDGETIQDFVINSDFEIQLYSRNNSTEKRVLKKTYILQNDGILK
uniref:Uncharacterized protein n=1 Tax=uncultured bacterium TB306_p TaxID=1552137 RepID=A0A0K0LBJ4_9BACT|nr:hypothetical protein [uncultured bacterium TB306_p]